MRSGLPIFTTPFRQALKQIFNNLLGVDLNPEADPDKPEVATYTYDAGGERSIRYIPGRFDAYYSAKEAGKNHRLEAILYPNSLVTVKTLPLPEEIEELENVTISKYTKHYYIGSERVASALGSIKSLGLLCESFGAGAALIQTMNNKVEITEEIISKVYDTFEKDLLLPAPFFYNEVFHRCDRTHYQDMYHPYWYHPDHLGSSSYITNLDGEINQHMEYLPFGELLVEEHLSSYNSPFKFSAKEFDSETGMYYFGARYYEPKWSIWISVDPLAEKYPSWSPYNYTMLNPVKYIDPNGKEVVWSAFLRKALGSKFIDNLSNTESFKTIFKRFINNQDNHFFNTQTLSNGRLGHAASAKIQRGGGIGANGFVTNIQEAYFVNGKLIADETFLVGAILHEGIHQRKNIRIHQDGKSEFPGYKDFYDNPYHTSRQGASDLHHNQMAEYNRQEILQGMKDFDKANGTNHTEDWYEAMSWFGLRRTEAYRDFAAKNPTKAKLYEGLIDKEIKQMEANKKKASSSNP